MKSDEAKTTVEPHTPGPWHFGGPVIRDEIESFSSVLTNEFFEIAQAGDEIAPGLCVVNTYYNPWTDRRTSAAANARLIAAAPDLLTAAEEARREIAHFLSVDESRKGGLYESALRKLESAIAKAKGIAP